MPTSGKSIGESKFSQGMDCRPGVQGESLKSFRELVNMVVAEDGTLETRDPCRKMAGNFSSFAQGLIGNYTIAQRGDVVIDVPVPSYAAVNVNNTVYSTLLVGNLLYVAGLFTSVTDSTGDSVRAKIACLDLNTARWTNWNCGVTAGNPRTMASDGTYLYAYSDSPITVNGLSRDYLIRYSLATGALDSSWSIFTIGGANSNSGCMNYINGSLYLMGGTMVFNTGTRYGVAKVTNGVVDLGFVCQDALSRTFNAGGSGNLIDIGVGVIGAVSEGLYGAAPHRSIGYSTFSATTGLISQMTNGFSGAIGTPGYNCQVVAVGTNVYLAGFDSVANGSVYDLPSLTVNAGNYAGAKAAIASTGAWLTAYAPSADGNNAAYDYGVATDGSSIFRLGTSLNAVASGCAIRKNAASNGAAVTGFGTGGTLGLYSSCTYIGFVKNMIVVSGGLTAGRNLSFFDPVLGTSL